MPWSYPCLCTHACLAIRKARLPAGSDDGVRVSGICRILRCRLRASGRTCLVHRADLVAGAPVRRERRQYVINLRYQAMTAVGVLLQSPSAF